MPTVFKLDQLMNPDSRFGTLIKILSTILITAALGLELGNLYLWLSRGIPIQGLRFIFAFERFAVISHGIEGAIAIIYASSRNQSPLKYSIYTFFVGTIGLIELFKQPVKEQAEG